MSGRVRPAQIHALWQQSNLCPCLRSLLQPFGRPCKVRFRISAIYPHLNQRQFHEIIPFVLPANWRVSVAVSCRVWSYDY
jgi:hypothetical protein